MTFGLILRTLVTQRRIRSLSFSLCRTTNATMSARDARIIESASETTGAESMNTQSNCVRTSFRSARKRSWPKTSAGFGGIGPHVMA